MHTVSSLVKHKCLFGDTLNEIYWMGHDWEKYVIALFHVSEHVDHFKAINIFVRKNGK